jgi:hypothetical protein
LAGFFAFSLGLSVPAGALDRIGAAVSAAKNPVPGATFGQIVTGDFIQGVGLNAGQLSLRDAAFAQRDLTQTASPVSGAAGSPSGVVRLWGEN